MSRKLFFALSLTVLLTIWSLWRWPSAKVVAPTSRILASQNQTYAATPFNSSTPEGSQQINQPLPIHWDATVVHIAQGNPFELLAPLLSEEQKKTQALAAAPPQAVIPPSPPQPTPTAPVLSYRVIGHMLNPDGKRFVYIAQGDTTLAVKEGTELKEGYVVEAITDNAIKLFYPPLDQHVSLPLPNTLSSSGSEKK